VAFSRARSASRRRKSAPAGLAAPMQMLDADIADGEDRIGVGAARNGARIKLFFPISIVAWRALG